jgi:hypothetical protein
MFLRISRPHLKPIILHPITCSPQSALRINGRLRTLLASFPSRAAATKSSGEVLTLRTPAVPPKPASNVPSRRLAPNAGEIQDARNNIWAKELSRSGPRLLFKVRSHAAFMCTGWIKGLLSFTCAFIMIDLRFWEQFPEFEEAPRWTILVFRLSSIFLIVLGSWAITRASRRISSIEILPGSDQPRLIINVRRNIPLPYIKPRRLNVLASDVTIHRRLVIPFTPIEKAPDESSLTKSDKGVIRGIARSISTMLYSIFAGVRQFIYLDGVASLSIKGYGGTWKLDIYGQFLDGGKPLYKILRMRD